MENSFSSIGYVPLRNNIDFSVSKYLSTQSTNNLQVSTEIKPDDQSSFSPLRSASTLIAPLSLFNYFSDLPDISIFSTLLPKNSAPSFESIRNGDGKVGISLGQVGASVRTLQQSLNKLGFTVKETGTFDVYTQTALKKFQASQKVEQTGILGKTTLAVLDQVTQVGKQQPNKGLAAVNKNMNPDDVSKFHYYQYSGLASQNGDCGPSVVKMVLGANNVNADIRQIRQVAGVPRARGGGAWAISEGELSKSINKLSNGKLREVERKTFNPLNHGKLISFLKSELNKGRMPVLLTGNNIAGRHYTVVVGIKPDGSILVADSTIRKTQNGGVNTYSPNNMRKRMVVSLLRGGTHVMSFENK